MLIYGINAVLEALRAGRVKTVRVSDRTNWRLSEVIKLAEREHVAITTATTGELDRAAQHKIHQGVVAEAVARERLDVADLLTSTHGVPLLVVLDGIEDPQNLGAIVRTVEVAGADGVIRQTRHAAPIAGAAARASAGATARVKIADVVNIARAVEELKEAGVWTIGLTGDAPKRLDQLDLTLPTALVLGNEGSGLRRLVRERCDLLAAIPMRGHLQSLNVSVTAGVALFEAVRQRTVASEGR